MLMLYVRRTTRGDPGDRLPSFPVLCVTALTWNPAVKACAVGRVYCGYVEGGNQAVEVPSRFSPVRLSLAAPCNYCPADKTDFGHGLVFVSAALVVPALSASAFSPKTLLGLRPPSPGDCLQMVPFRQPFRACLSLAL